LIGISRSSWARNPKFAASCTGSSQNFAEASSRST
jgi:hypothetical protein